MANPERLPQTPLTAEDQITKLGLSLSDIPHLKDEFVKWFQNMEAQSAAFRKRNAKEIKEIKKRLSSAEEQDEPRDQIVFLKKNLSTALNEGRQNLLAQIENCRRMVGWHQEKVHEATPGHFPPDSDKGGGGFPEWAKEHYNTLCEFLALEKKRQSYFEKKLELLTKKLLEQTA